MNFYFLTIILSSILFISIIIYLSKLSTVFMYEFRNVLIAAFLPALAILIVYLLMNYSDKSSFSFMSLLLEFPPAFANISVLLIIILGIMMGISNLSLMRHEGMAIKNTVGTVLQIIWIIFTVAAYVLVHVLHNYAATTGILQFLCNFLPYFLYCMIDYGECMMIGIMIMGYVAAVGHSAYDKDFIIIPGCSIAKNGGLLPLLKGRVDRAMRYAWQQEIETGKPVYFVPSGGQGNDEVMSEGSAMGLYLLSHSAEDSEVFPEKNSKNTEENFLYSAAIINSLKENPKVAFATTNYHVLRCGMLAKKVGLNAEGLASTTKWYFWPNGFAREVVAIVNMTRKYHILATCFICVVAMILTCIL